jgi:CheY-like chemotaxis protein
MFHCQCDGYTIEDLFDLVFPSEMGVTGYMCMVYHCFLDDSKDQTQTKLMVSAGFFGTKEEWGSLRAGWVRVLEKHGLLYFKSSEYYSLTEQFARFSTDEYPRPKGREAAQQIRSELQAVVQQHPGIRGVGASVLLETYYGVYARPEAVNILPSNPYDAALASVMHETTKIIRARPGRNVISFVHDNGADYEHLRAVYKTFRLANPDIAKSIAEFIPLDDKQHPPLQAADMIANYTMHLGLEGLASGNMKANVKEMRQNINLLVYWGKHYLLSVLKKNLIANGKPIPIDSGEAENGREAVEKAQELHPDLILLDLSMPVMNGLDATRVLKRVMPEVPIVMYSAYSDSFTEKEARSAGVSALVSKSEHTSVLLSKARSFLTR